MSSLPPPPPPHTHTHTVDDNRVILEDVNKVAGEDYINASFINGYYNRVEFIATQHPVATTRGDLWRMIVERDVNTLVVIGALEDESVSLVATLKTLLFAGTKFSEISHLPIFR